MRLGILIVLNFQVQTRKLLIVGKDFYQIEKDFFISVVFGIFY
jgi:hypothetical protein